MCWEYNLAGHDLRHSGRFCMILKELNIVSLGKDLKMIKNNHDIESLQVMLIKMIEDRMLSEDDYNLITKYLDKLKNDLNKK